MAPEILKDVLGRLRAQRIEVTPATFAWAYRQALAQRDMVLGEQYTGWLSALRHALYALSDLFLPDEWLASRLQRLAALAADESIDEVSLLVQVHAELDAITQGKRHVLAQVATSVEALRAALASTIGELAALQAALAGSRTDLGRYEKLVTECDSVDGARTVLRLMADDMRRLHDDVGVRRTAARMERQRIETATRELLRDIARAGAHRLRMPSEALD
jgi:hypothetical protein